MLKKILHPGVIEAASRGCNWLAYILLPVWLGTSEFGEFSFILALVLLVSALGTAGQDRAFLRFISVISLRTSLRVNAAVMIAVCCALACVILIAGIKLGTSLLPSFDISWALVFFWIFLQTGYLLMAALARALSDHAAFAVIRGTYGFSKLILLNLVAALCQDVYWLIVTEVVLLIAVWLYSAIRFRSLYRPILSRPVVKKSFWFGAPLILHVLAGAALGQLDKLMIGSMLDAASLGVYAFLNSIASGVFFVFAVLNIVFETQVYRSGNSQAAEKIMSKMLSYSLFSAIGILVVVNLGLEHALDFLGKVDYYNGSVLGILSVAYLVYPLYLQANVRFVYAKHTKWIPVMTGSAAMVNVGANLILIPRMGIEGAAWSTLVAYLVLVTMSQLVSRSTK